MTGIDADHALILLPDQILEFEAVGRTSRVVLASQDDWHWKLCLDAPGTHRQRLDNRTSRSGQIIDSGPQMAGMRQTPGRVYGPRGAV